MFTRSGIVAVVALSTILAAGLPAVAMGGYVINGRQANYYEANLLRMYGYRPGSYIVDQQGRVRAADGYNFRSDYGSGMHDGNCGYVEGVPVDGCP